MKRLIAAAPLVVVLLAGTQAGAVAGEIDLRVSDVLDGAEQTWYTTGSDEVEGLNRTSSSDAIEIDEGSYWEARFFPAFPDGASPGTALTSVTIEISYRTEFHFLGDSAITVLADGAALVNLTAPASESWNSVTIDATESILAHAAPFDAVNRLAVRFDNMSSDGEAEWRYARASVTYVSHAPATPAIVSPENRQTGLSVNLALVASDYAHPAGLAHASTDWRIYADSGRDRLAAECVADTNNLTSVIVDASAFSFVGDLAGATSLAAGTTYWATVAYRDSIGAVSVSNTIRFTTSTSPPNNPSITAPGSGATVSRNPTVTTSPYSHPDDVRHASTDWEVFADAGQTVRVASSMGDRSNHESIVIAAGSVSFEGPRAGETTLAGSTDYWVRAVHRDEGGGSADSTAVRFRTQANQSPNAPVITSPTGGQTGISRVPAISAGPFSDPDGDRHASTDWEVFRNAGLTSRVAHAMGRTNQLRTINLGNEAVVYEGALAGRRSLAPETAYWAVVTYRDSGGATARSEAVHFVTALNTAPNPPVVVTPASSSNVPRNATFVLGAFSDPDNDAHLATDWQIFDDSALTTLAAASVDDRVRLDRIEIGQGHMAFFGSLAGERSLRPRTEYWLAVAHVDSYGGRAETVFHFTTAVGTPPARASIVSPEPDEEGVSQNPVVRTDAYEDPDGDAHAYTDWEFYGAPGLNQLLASSLNDRRHLTAIRVNEKTVEFAGELEGALSLELDSWYWVRARFVDASGEAGQWSQTIRFRTSERYLPPDNAWPLYGAGCLPRGTGRSAPVWLPLAVAFMAICRRLILAIITP